MERSLTSPAFTTSWPGRRGSASLPTDLTPGLDSLLRHLNECWKALLLPVRISPLATRSRVRGPPLANLTNTPNLTVTLPPPKPLAAVAAWTEQVANVSASRSQPRRTSPYPSLNTSSVRSLGRPVAAAFVPAA